MTSELLHGHHDPELPRLLGVGLCGSAVGAVDIGYMYGHRETSTSFLRDCFSRVVALLKESMFSNPRLRICLFFLAFYCFKFRHIKLKT